MCESDCEKPRFSIERGVVWLEDTDRELIDDCERPFDEAGSASELPLRKPGVLASETSVLAVWGG